MKKKPCTKCGRVKQLNDFPLKRGGHKNREYQDICHACKSFYRSVSPIKPIGKLKKASTGLSPVKARKVIEEVKRDKHCEICGETYIYCKDYHHRDPRIKVAHIGDIPAQKWSRQEILEELGRCSILCANCHRIVHSIIQILISTGDITKEDVKLVEDGKRRGFIKKAYDVSLFKFVEIEYEIPVKKLMKRLKVRGF